jgi:nitronate monooxygenase
MDTALTRDAGISVPLIGGAMYPCSNPELVAAVSKAGGIGIVQPISLVFVHKHDFREGLRKIKADAGGKPIGLNLLIEKSSDIYLERNRKWLDIALEEGVRFFITALGDPKWVVDKVKPFGAIVYHDVTERKWAEKAVKAGVNGLICVNNRAGGHAGDLAPQKLAEDLKSLGLPLVCAGGIGKPQDFAAALKMGYAGVQLGTRFIATTECTAHEDYKKAILKAKADDIVLTVKLTGVPVAVIRTEYIKKMGIEPDPVTKMLLKHPKTKHYVRMFLSVRSLFQLKKSLKKGSAYKDFFQAGKSVDGIDAVEPAGEIVKRFAAAIA